MTKLKLGFDIDGESNWETESFRTVIKDLVYDTERYEMYLITKNTDSVYVNGIVTLLGMNVNNVFQAIASNTAIVTQLDTSGIDIYLTGDIEVYDLTNATSVDTIGIYVNNAIQDEYNVNPKWFSQLVFWVDRLTNISTNGEIC